GIADIAGHVRRDLVTRPGRGVEPTVSALAVERRADPIDEMDKGEVVPAPDRRREARRNVEGVARIEAVIAVGGLELDRRERTVGLVDDDPEPRHGERARVDDPKLIRRFEVHVGMIEAGAQDEIVAVSEERGALAALQRAAEAKRGDGAVVVLAGYPAAEDARWHLSAAAVDQRSRIVAEAEQRGIGTELRVGGVSVE